MEYMRRIFLHEVVLVSTLAAAAPMEELSLGSLDLRKGLPDMMM